MTHVSCVNIPWSPRKRWYKLWRLRHNLYHLFSWQAWYANTRTMRHHLFCSWPLKVCSKQRSMRHDSYHLFCFWVPLGDDVQTYILTYSRLHIHTRHTCMHTHTCKCTYVHIYIYNCTYIYISIFAFLAHIVNHTLYQPFVAKYVIVEWQSQTKWMIQIMTHGSLHAAYHQGIQTKKDDTNYDACSVWYSEQWS